jgi:SulP family sulfate permease
LTTAVPSPLIAVAGLTIITVAAGLVLPNVADQGALPNSLPALMLPDVPLNFETLRLIGPVALAIALVGLLESLLTAKLVDDITDTHSNKTRESWGQGVANIVTGFFGGMGGCAMIGQTMINVRSGARTRLSTFLAGLLLLILVVALGDVVGLIPMAALVAVMVFVAYATFDWHSLRSLPKMPRSETIVMLMTVAATVITHNLAIGVIAGVLTACVLFARRVARLATMSSELSPDGGTRTYHVHGALFFASSNDLVYQFDYAGDPERVVIDLTYAHVWDASTVATLDAVAYKYHRRGKTVELIGLNRQSADFRARLEGLLKASH